MSFEPTAVESGLVSNARNSQINIEPDRALVFRPYKPNLGATVVGVDFSRPQPPDIAVQLRDALLQYGVLFFQAGELSGQAYFEFVKVFGKPSRHNAYVPAIPSALDLKESEAPPIDVIQTLPTRKPRNDVWHIDGGYTRIPPDITTLYGYELPDQGGDTLWTNAALAYQRLDPLFAAYLETLTAVNSFESTGLTSWMNESPERLADMRVKYPPIEVPIIRRHPVTGEKQIFVTEAVTGYIKGLSRVASQSLLTLLFDHLKAPEFQARFSWTAGALAVWDNCKVQHRVVEDYDPLSRVMHRFALLRDPALR